MGRWVVLAWIVMAVATGALWLIRRRLPQHSTVVRARLKTVVILLIVVLATALVLAVVPLAMIEFLKGRDVDLSFLRGKEGTAVTVLPASTPPEK